MKMMKSTWFVVAALLMAALFGYGSMRSYIRNYNINKEIASLEKKQQELEKKRSDLSSLLKNIQSNAFAEEQAREQFGLRKPGEKAVVIERDESVAKEDVARAHDTDISNPERWWKYFFALHERG